MVRMIALMDEETSKEAKIKEDLMSTEFPLIWIEVDRRNEIFFVDLWLLQRMDPKRCELRGRTATKTRNPKKTDGESY